METKWMGQLRYLKKGIQYLRGKFGLIFLNQNRTDSRYGYKYCHNALLTKLESISCCQV